MHGIFTNVLWYLEFVAFAFILIGFFCLFLYLASINYVQYNLRYDYRKNPIQHYFENRTSTPPPRRKPPEPNQRPVCCDIGCVWFCRLVGSIITIAVCYYFAYQLISDTKLRFGMFVP